MRRLYARPTVRDPQTAHEWLTVYGGEWPMPPAMQAEVNAIRERRAFMRSYFEAAGRAAAKSLDEMFMAATKEV